MRERNAKHILGRVYNALPPAPIPSGPFRRPPRADGDARGAGGRCIHERQRAASQADGAPLRRYAATSSRPHFIGTPTRSLRAHGAVAPGDNLRVRGFGGITCFWPPASTNVGEPPLHRDGDAQPARLWRRCEGRLLPGARVACNNEFHAPDAGGPFRARRPWFRRRDRRRADGDAGRGRHRIHGLRGPVGGWHIVLCRDAGASLHARGAVARDDYFRVPGGRKAAQLRACHETGNVGGRPLQRDGDAQAGTPAARVRRAILPAGPVRVR